MDCSLFFLLLTWYFRKVLLFLAPRVPSKDLLNLGYLFLEVMSCSGSQRIMKSLKIQVEERQRLLLLIPCMHLEGDCAVFSGYNIFGILSNPNLNRPTLNS